jgi:DNA-binding transcriptional MerR regulator
MARSSSTAVKEKPPGDGEGGPGEGWMPIDDLAAAAGVTVRTVRSHQGRGLLPPPAVHQRVGYYGPEHLDRLRLILELQAEGFNLKGIRRLLDEAGGPAENLLGLKRVVTEPFDSTEAEVFTIEDLQTRFGDDGLDPRNLTKAEKLGLLIPLGGERFEAPSPALLDAAEEVMSRGVPLRDALSVVEDVQRSCEKVARRFVELFLEDVYKPFEEAGHPEERWGELTETIERLRPLATDVLEAVFAQTMTQEVERGFGKQIEKLTGSKR